MGTRADFYVGRGESAEWLGSIAWDGYPDGIDAVVLKATTEKQFRSRLAKFFGTREDVTLPEQGWPWPWENSLTTDYSYAFDKGATWATNWGYRWWRAAGPEPEDDHDGEKQAVFPDMTARQNVTLGKRSGVMVISSARVQTGEE